MCKLVWSTGISHVGGNEYLRDKFLPLCRKRGKSVTIIYPGKMLFDPEVPGIELNPNNVLNAPDDHLNPKMNWVFEKIVQKLKVISEKFDAIVIKTHRLFKWENVYRLAHAYENVMRFNPDLIITFVDGIAPILERLSASSQFYYQSYAVDYRAGLRGDKAKLAQAKKDICDWQDLEIKLTCEWAEAMKKKFFVIPSGESAEVLYELVFNPAAEPTYVAIDITRSVPEINQQVSRFIEKVRSLLPCLISPYSVPLSYDNRHNVEDSHIVQLCLEWFVPQAENVIGFYPAPLPTSEGKTHELGKAFIFTKNVWIVHLPPLDEASPFVKSFKTIPIFRSEAEFFKFLEARKRIKNPPVNLKR